MNRYNVAVHIYEAADPRVIGEQRIMLIVEVSAIDTH